MAGGVGLLNTVAVDDFNMGGRCAFCPGPESWWLEGWLAGTCCNAVVDFYKWVQSEGGRWADVLVARHRARRPAPASRPALPCLLPPAGAMENKSLNIFNSRLVLATPDTATDMDFARIEGERVLHDI